MAELLKYLPLIIATIAVISAFITVKISQDIFKKDIHLLRAIIFDNTGRLNVVDAKSCREYRNGMDKLHEENKEDHKAIMKIITKLSRNVDRILFKMEIEPHPGDES